MLISADSPEEWLSIVVRLLDYLLFWFFNYGL